ncbi:MAG: hypothetical protein MJY75_04175 [Bacteroidaceae bacterium]|nr:hypothetical protein [Bacteroidaceae bacterium]
MKYCFIINNGPGKTSNAPKIIDAISALDTPIEHRIFKTTAVRTATEFVAAECRSHPEQEICFVACGGDGTINEVATGMMKGGPRNKHLAVLSYGSGNDFIKYYPGLDFRSIRSLVNGTAHSIDIMKVNGCAYSINVCNFGFDATVCATANRLTRKGWHNVYRWGVAYAIFCARFNRIDVTADGEPLNRGRRMLLCTLGNNNYVGGEFRCSPRACNDDGLIEVGHVRSISLLNFLRLIKDYRNGTHLDNPATAGYFTYRRARKVEIHSHKPTELCLDGEMLPGQDFTVEIVPGAISFIIPSDRN